MIAELHIQTINRNGITCLEHVYFTSPFKIINITEDKQSGPLHLMLMNASPGVLDGDHYHIKIELKENSFLQLHSQSYQRLFNMKTGAAQDIEICLAENSSFVYLPHPAVPHENSSFIAMNKIHATNSSTLIWGEILTCGRKLSKGSFAENGEVFLFSRYRNITEVFLDDKLIIKDNLLMQPAIIDPSMIGQLEGFTHQASLICLYPNGSIREKTDIIHEYLDGQENMLPGVTTTSGNGLLVRILGYGAEQLHEHLQAIAALILQKQKKEDPQPAHAN